MTLAEVVRFCESKRRVQKELDRKQASFDYILADLIGHSVARAFNNTKEMPKISAAYPSLYKDEEVEEKVQEKQDELSALRFKLFADSFNKKFKEVRKEE